MASNYDNVDLKWTRSGDFAIDRGDIADTAEDHIVSLIQDIQTVCQSSLGDWEIWKNLGASPEDFVGRPNSPATASLLHDRLKAAITSLRIVKESDLEILIIPVQRMEVVVIIKVDVTNTPYNSMSSSQKLLVQFVYNYMENNIFFLQNEESMI